MAVSNKCSTTDNRGNSNVDIEMDMDFENVGNGNGDDNDNKARHGMTQPYHRYSTSIFTHL